MAPLCKWPIIKLNVCVIILIDQSMIFCTEMCTKDSVIQFCHSPYIVFSFFPLWKRNIQVQNPEKGTKKMSENLESSRYLTCSESTLSIQQLDAYFN